MIGNDIVDLNHSGVQSNWKRRGFLSKIFSEEEQEILLASEDKNKLLWRMWSMKEAAYKAHQRRFDLEPKFNPKSFCCSIISEEEGKVRTPAAEYFCTTKNDDNFIYSEAVIKKMNLRRISEVKKNISRERLQNAVFPHVLRNSGKEGPSEIAIEKCKHRIPRILLGGKEIKILVSFTHHGAYSAYFLAFPT